MSPRGQGRPQGLHLYPQPPTFFTQFIKLSQNFDSALEFSPLTLKIGLLSITVAIEEQKYWLPVP